MLPMKQLMQQHHKVAAKSVAYIAANKYKLSVYKSMDLFTNIDDCMSLPQCYVLALNAGCLLSISKK
jgi:hypothetical protein